MKILNGCVVAPDARTNIARRTMCRLTTTDDATKEEKKYCVRCTVTVNIFAEPRQLMFAENYTNSKFIYLTIYTN